jgi:threonine aldolase
MQIINLISDTQTLPTDAMYAAMRDAPLGDDMIDADPTVQKLESMAARMLGMEAAMLVISGTMGNLVSLMAHADPGDEVILDSEAHIYYYEAGSIANVAGLMPMLVPSRKGFLDPKDVAAAVRRKDQHFPVSRVLCLENTHNRSGGRVIPLELHNDLCRTAREHDLAVHLDGARIFNAAMAAGVSVTAYTEHVDSVMFCLSKGLSCPLGSLVVGSREFIHEAERARKRVGGAMRQAGVVAACGIVALESMVDRLAEDHANARRLAEGLAAIEGFHIEMETVESNMVNVDHTPSGFSTEEVLARLEKEGVLASNRAPTHIRLVTNRHHSAADIDEAVERIGRAMKGTRA